MQQLSFYNDGLHIYFTTMNILYCDALLNYVFQDLLTSKVDTE